ncbi:uncharacterized protein LOC116266974 [Nymphaea colorata]|nr:uncharacterized protein LOC116266974 [Nymphaea colorata]
MARLREPAVPIQYQLLSTCSLSLSLTAQAEGETKMRVAVIGGGVSGLVSAYILAKAGVHVVLYEKEAHLGGHAQTVHVNGVDLDLGFMVFNGVTYPNMMELFENLGVIVQRSDMSFSVSLDEATLSNMRTTLTLIAVRHLDSSSSHWVTLMHFGTIILSRCVPQFGRAPLNKCSTALLTVCSHSAETIMPFKCLIWFP